MLTFQNKAVKAPNGFQPFLRRAFRILAIWLLVAGTAAPATASDLIYRPINPSFGGNPLNSGHLRGLAESQKNFDEETASLSTSSTQTNAERFVSSLESRLLSALSSQVADAIFGDNPQDAGTVVFGDTTVTFVRGLETISLTITDPETGVTEIEVPILQVQ